MVEDSSGNLFGTTYEGGGNGDGTVFELEAAYGLTVTAASTSTVLTSAADPSVYGQTVTFTATVSNSSGTGVTPTGIVTFEDGGAALPNGAVTLTEWHSHLHHEYLGCVGEPADDHSGVRDSTGNFAGSLGTLMGGQTVKQVSTTTVVTSALNPSVFSQSVTFTATVTVNSPGAGSVTSGTVTFFDNGRLLGATQVLGGINASNLATSSLSVTSPSALQTITASYSGDSVNFAASGTSCPVSQTVLQASTTTTVNSSVNPSFFGQNVRFTATVDSSGNLAILLRARCSLWWTGATMVRR